MSGPTVMPGLKAVLYRRHRCSRHHRTFDATVRCVWPTAAWITGRGAWAAVSTCRRTTVSLHGTEAEARRALEDIAAYGCGGACTQRHRLIRLADELIAGVMP